MQIGFKQLLSGVAVSVFLLADISWSQTVVGKVIDSYSQNETTYVTLEVYKTLVVGQNIFLSNGATMVAGELLGEKEGIFYYNASTLQKIIIPIGTDVVMEESNAVNRRKHMFLKLERKTTFAPKKREEITAVQKDRALVDKGSLHEVRERDLYRIYDSRGKYKGMLELRGVGDFQSSGKLYHTLEEKYRKLNIQQGDTVKYAGQRKLFGIGLMVGKHLSLPKLSVTSFDSATVQSEYRGQSKNIEVVLESREDVPKSNGGGLLWTLTFPDGWGAESLFGAYFGEASIGNFSLKRVDVNGTVKDFIVVPENTPVGFGSAGIKSERYKITILAPTLLRKNFFFPRAISPYIGAGGFYFEGEYEISRVSTQIPKEAIEFLFPNNFLHGVQLSRSAKKTGVFPVFSYGVDLFPARFFHMRFDAKYFMTPDLTTDLGYVRTRGWVYSVGLITAW